MRKEEGEEIERGRGDENQAAKEGDGNKKEMEMERGWTGRKEVRERKRRRGRREKRRER